MYRNDLISVMLSAPFHTTKAVLPGMLEKGVHPLHTFHQEVMQSLTSMSKTGVFLPVSRRTWCV